MSRGKFIFNGIDSSAYGVYISGAETYGAAARDFTQIDVPGRNGLLTMDNGRFIPLTHSYEAFIIDNFSANVEGFRNAIMAVRGAVELSDTYHPDEFYLAFYERGLEPDVSRIMREGSFKLEFTRDPRRFLVSGKTQTVISSSSGSITNPTLYDARPITRIVGTGTVSINGTTVQISYNPGYIDLDSEIQDAYYGTMNCNNYVSISGDDFPTLKAGNNAITKTSSISQITITPNWFIL